MHRKASKEKIDLALTICFGHLLILALLQLEIILHGDPFHEQDFLNYCWGILSIVAFTAIQIKFASLIERARKEITQIEKQHSSPYIRQGGDERTMGTETREARAPFY